MILFNPLDDPDQVRPNYLHTLRAEVERKARLCPGLISMVLGEPEFARPDFIDDAMIRSIKEDKAGYAPMGGIPKLKDAISRYIFRISGVQYDSDSEILVTAGAKEALALAGAVCSRSQDLILTQIPAWTGYEGIAEVSRGCLMSIPTRGRLIAASDLESALGVMRNSWKNTSADDAMIYHRLTGRKVAAVLVNSPNNPTGAVISLEEQDILAKYLVGKDLILISDEVYKSYIFDDVPYRPFCAVPGIKDRLVFIDSLSKTYNTTDMRVGFMAGPPGFVRRACASHGNWLTCLPKSVQEGAVAALDSGDAGERFVAARRQEYQRRRDVFFDGLSQMPGFDSVPQNPPQGTFYAWVDISGFGMASEEYFLKLLEEGVACAPGKPFGDDRFVRYSLTVDPALYPQYQDVFAEILCRHGSFARKYAK